MPKNTLEKQGDDCPVQGLEDEIYARNEQGQLVRLEVSDDAQDD